MHLSLEEFNRQKARQEKRLILEQEQKQIQNWDDERLLKHIHSVNTFPLKVPKSPHPAAELKDKASKKNVGKTMKTVFCLEELHQVLNTPLD